MASVVQICNMALSSIGDASTIQSLTEESTQAKHCNLHYSLALDSVLQEFAWPFATKTIALASVGTPPSDWAYQYAYPNDALRLFGIVTQSRTGEKIPYTTALDSIQNLRVIQTDQEAAVIRYVTRITDTALFPPMFVQALLLSLAARIAMPLTRDSGISQQATQQYRQAINAAWGQAANESQQGESVSCEWHRDRF